jgi:two-component system chemotaxis sensor kinase CheA
MDDLLNEFLSETNESLISLDQKFVELEQNPKNQEIIQSIFRVMHTIKGTSGFLAFSRLEKVAHSAENLMDKVRNSQIEVTSELISLILKTSDIIKQIVEEIAENSAEKEGDDSEIIEEIHKFVESGGKNTKAVNKAEKLKTPDLDEEVDFDPIPAPYAVESDNKIAEDKANKQKTPDLDEEIDFDPIPAPYATEDNQLPVKKDLDKEQKKKAVEIGLKATEGNEAEKKTNTANSNQSIRVNIDILENLMQLVGELVLTRNQILQVKRSSEGQLDSKFNSSLQRLNIITTELQEGVMKTRMQNIGSAWQKFPRLIRDLSNDLGKKIILKMEGEETEIDRQMLEAIKDPLMHMVRNAADHGIERPDERTKKQKSAEGTIWLRAYHEGGHIVIKISDDGKGIDVEAIKKKVLEKNLASFEEIKTLSDKQIYQYIFKPGFSTAEKVTSVSGRGVGMDVVQSNIKAIGGTIEINSGINKGSEFLIKLPLTLAIMPVLIFATSQLKFAIPQIWVSEVVRISDKNSKIVKLRRDESKIHKLEVINGKPVLRLREHLVPIINLNEVLKIEEDKTIYEHYVIVCELGSSHFGIYVDKVFHTEEIVIKPKSNLIKNIEIFSGSTILGDGSVILIVDPAGILKSLDVSVVNETNKQKNKEIFEDEEIAFLLFTTEDGTPRAIPLELVSRLEEIDYSKVENSAGSKVVQYRNSLMKITTLDDSGYIPNEGVNDTIVFADRGRVLGVYVKSITDITRMKMDLKSTSSKQGILGSMIINGKATEIVDISYYISREFSDWLGHVEANKLEGKNYRTKKHVLLVDDSSFFRKFMRPVILSANYKVTTCEDGKQALEILKKHAHEFDIVITDIDMPVMNGIELVKAIKSDNLISYLPVVALSSHEHDDFGVDTKEIGFDSFVTKSNRNKVLETITEILKERKLAAANE